MSKTKRTAIVFVHGQGEQRPMDSVRDLVRTAWATDERFGGEGTDSDWLRYWSIPDERSDSYEMQRLSTEATESGDPDFEKERFDFYEYYWAHLMSGTSFGHVWSWFQKLVQRHVAEVPNPLLRVRQILVRILETMVSFAIVGMALSIYLIDNFLAKDPRDSQSQHWAANWIFELVIDHALLIALLAAPFIGILSIAGDRVRTSENKTEETDSHHSRGRSFNPGGIAKNLIIGAGALMVPLIGLQSSSEGHLAAGIMDGLVVALVLTTALMAARVVMGAAAIGVMGVCAGLITVIALPFGLIDPHFAPLYDLDPTIILVPMLSCLLSGAVFYAGSLLGSYSIALVLSVVSLAACIWGAEVVFDVGLVQPQDEQTVQIAALAAAWAVAYALLLPEAARFNTSGLKKGQQSWRGAHLVQLGIWLLVPTAMLVLVQDRAFTTEVDASAIFPITWQTDTFSLGWNGHFTAAFAIAAAYALFWLAAQNILPKFLNERITRQPEKLRVVTHVGFLFVHLVMWFTWCVFLHSAILEGSAWPAYWMFMATVFALPSLAVLLVAANRAFLIPVLGDSARYLSPVPDNIEARQKIRETGVQFLESLHKDRPYDRIIVVAHSLGSIVALDILKQLWARRVDDLHTSDLSKLLTKVEDAATDLNAAVATSGPETTSVECARQAFRLAQSNYAKALRKKDVDESKVTEKAWLISDFITLGSPLTYAPFLLADTDNDFRRRLAKFEIPSCPPSREILDGENYLRGDDGLFVYNKRSPKEGKTFAGPRHGALFAAVRWSNLYFATPGMVTGDLIGGELGSKFGYGIDSYTICERPGTVMFAHNEYWKWQPRSGTEGKTGHQIRAALMDEQVPEHVVALRAALNLSDADEFSSVEDQVRSSGKTKQPADG